MPGFRSGIFSSLQFRLAAGFVLALAVALSLIGLATGVVAGQQAQRFERDRGLAQEARVRQFVSDYYAETGDWSSANPDLQRALERTGSAIGKRIMVFDEQGELIADSHAALHERFLGDGVRRAFWKNERKLPVLRGNEEVGAFSVSTLSLGGQGAANILDPAPARISQGVKRSLLWAGIGAAALGTLLVWLLSRRTLAPLQNLGATARRLGSGDLSQRAEATGPTEIRELAHSFNAMAQGLEEAERQRRNLTADVAHELRTPLSNIQGYLEAIRDGLVEPNAETIGTIHGQAIHLSRLVEDLRILAQVEAGALQLHTATVDLPELLRDCVEAVRPRSETEGITLVLEAEDSLQGLELDSTRISQVVGNLLDNAIHHTPEGGKVTVSARPVSGAVEVSVSDTGPGIPQEELPRIFDRFYRTDPSRDRSTGGAGLGLTIARRLVEAHGGAIEAQSVVGEGSRFIVRLPG